MDDDHIVDVDVREVAEGPKIGVVAANRLAAALVVSPPLIGLQPGSMSVILVVDWSFELVSLQQN